MNDTVGVLCATRYTAGPDANIAVVMGTGNLPSRVVLANQGELKECKTPQGTINDTKRACLLASVNEAGKR